MTAGRTVGCQHGAPDGQKVRGPHGCIPSVDYSFRSVLATGIAGVGALPDRVVADTAASNRGYRGERRARIDQRHIYASRAALARAAGDLKQGSKYSRR